MNDCQAWLSTITLNLHNFPVNEIPVSLLDRHGKEGSEWSHLVGQECVVHERSLDFPAFRKRECQLHFPTLV